VDAATSRYHAQMRPMRPNPIFTIITTVVFSLLSVAALASTATSTQPPTTGVWTYAYAEYGDIKYPEGFAHYDFVNPDAPKGGTMRLSNTDRRTSFDKYNSFTLPQTSPAGVDQYMFESLTDASPDEPATMYGLIAKQMLVAPDYTSISFRIDPLAHFNNGDPVTADDVKYSFDMAVSPVAAPSYAQYFTNVKEAIVVDSRTVRFNLKVPSRDQIFTLGTQLDVFSRKWGQGPDGKIKPFDQIVHEVPISTGPYIVSKGTGQMLDLARDPHYWARDLGVRKGYFNFDHLIYHYYNDEAARFEGFKADDFDLMEEYSAKRFVRLFVGSKFRDGEIIKRKLPIGMSFYYEGYLLNSRRPEFSDWRVRDALDYAFDWNWSVAQGYRMGRRFHGFFAASPYLPSGLPSAGELALLEPYRKDLLPQVFAVPAPNPVSDTPADLRANLLYARKLLAEAGWTIHSDGLLRNAKGEAFQIEVMEDNFEFQPFIDRWAVSLKKLGITTRLRVVDYAIYEKRLEAFDFDCVLINYGQFKLPSPAILQDFFGSAAAKSPGSGNLMGISNPAIDHIIDFMNNATTLGEITDGARALDRVFMAGHYAVPYLYLPDTLVAYWDKFGIPETLPKYYTFDDGLYAMAWSISTWWSKSAH
jgi:microcin C transport system substrate-binding protein